MKNLFLQAFNEPCQNLVLERSSEDELNSEKSILFAALMQNSFPDECAVQIYEILVKEASEDYRITIANSKEMILCSLGSLQNTFITTKFSKDDHALGLFIKKHTNTILFHKKILFHIGPIVNLNQMLKDFLLVDLSSASWMQEFARHVRPI